MRTILLFATVQGQLNEQLQGQRHGRHDPHPSSFPNKTLTAQLLGVQVIKHTVDQVGHREKRSSPLERLRPRHPHREGLFWVTSLRGFKKRSSPTKR